MALDFFIIEENILYYFRNIIIEACLFKSRVG